MTNPDVSITPSNFQFFAARITAIYLALGFLMALALQCAHAQTPAPQSLSSNRYLLILDTSRTMKPRLPGTVSTLSNLFEGSLGQQMRNGDSLGVWTFNSALVTGEFPLQKWTTNQQATVRNQILRFAASRSYERKADFGQVQLALDRVLQNAELLTVVLITSGETPVQGTPFNESINAILEQWQGELREQQKPIVVVLRGKSGIWSHYSASPAPFPVELPPLPKVAAAPKPQEPAIAAPPTNPPPQRVLPSLILSGKTVKQPPSAPKEVPSTNSDASVSSPASPEPKNAPSPPPTVTLPNVSSNAAQATTPSPARAPAIPTNGPGVTGAIPVPEPKLETTDGAVTQQDGAIIGTPSGSVVVAAVPEPKPTGSKRVLFLGLLVAGLLLLLTVLVIWRWQRPQQPSLITRSLEKKP